MFSMQLLGSPQIYLDGQPVKLARRKSRAVLYFVAASSEPVSRERLLALLWPDTPRPAGLQVLRTTLHGLRRSLGQAMLVQDEQIKLAPDAQVDTRQFEAQISRATASGLAPDEAISTLEAALALYRGDFLSTVDVEAQAFDDWIAVERERYRRMAVRGWMALCSQYERAGNLASALASLERALVFDPLQEDLQREAMRFQYLLGDRPGAIRRYDQLRRTLDSEMGVPPMAETRTLYDAILNDSRAGVGGLEAPGRPSRRPGAPDSPAPNKERRALPFVGRTAEMETLKQSAWDSTPRLILIEGEPGIGKTRLAGEFIRSAGAMALAGVARELEQSLPYQPVIEALRSLESRPEWPQLLETLNADLPRVWLAEMARLLPELGSSFEPPLPALAVDESRLWEAVNQFLPALARDRSLILFLDDLQWADASTLALLGYLVRQTRRAPLAFVATARPTIPRSPLAALLQTLTRENRLVRLPLPRLDAEGILAIAHHLSPTFAYPLANWLARNSEGTPYVLAELVRHARENGLLVADGLVNLDRLSSSPVVPQPVYTLIQSRLDRLSDPARRVLDVAVAAGREFDFEAVQRATGLSEGAALDGLDELRGAGLVHPLDGTRLRFDHSLTMEVAYREVGEARHRLLHRRLAEALESLHGRARLDSAAGLIASHFAEGGDVDRAAPYAFRAGQQAARLAAWQEAITFYEQALNGNLDDGLRRSILMDLGDARFRAGQAPQSSEAYRDALALSAPGSLEQDSARLALAQSFFSQARFAEAIALAREVRTRGRPESAVQAEFVWGTALSLEGADLQGAADHLRAAEALVGQADNPMLSEIKFELGSVLAQQGDLPGAIELYRQSLAAAEASGEQSMPLPRRVLAYNNLAYHLHLLGDETAAEYVRRGLDLAQEMGAVTLKPYLYSTAGEIALAAGSLDEADKDFSEGLALAEGLSMPERIAGLTANLGLVARARGQMDIAILRLSSALARADSLGIQHLSAQIRLWLAPLLPPAQARVYLAEAREIAANGGRLRLLEQAEALERSLG